MLEMAGIPAWNTERLEKDPIVLVGGPAVSGNPEPYADFADAIVIGEGDYVVHTIVESLKTAGSREEAMTQLSRTPSVYVPVREQGQIKRGVVADLDSVFHPTRQVIPIVDEGDKREPVFGKALLVEVTRGCKHSCKFCLIGHISRPGRARSLDVLQEIITRGTQETPVNKIALIGSSVGDMNELEDLMQWMSDEGYEFSVPSLRADRITKRTLELLARAGQRTLTFAPETGSEELRRFLGKGLNDSEIERASTLAAESGMKAIKLYFIIGLPRETDDDVRSIGAMIRRVSELSGLRVTASVNPFIPKARTRFEREVQLPLEEVRRRFKLIREDIKGIPHAEIETLDPRLARIQASLSLGDRTLSRLILKASRYGGLGGWRRAERETGIEFFGLATDSERLTGKLPWSFIS